MARGPRTPQGIAAVTRTIERVNALGLNRRRGPGKREPDRAAALQQPKVRTLAAQIVAVLEGEGQRITRPADRVMIELLATALALAWVRLAQNENPIVASRALLATSSRSPGGQETGNVANVLGGGPRGGAKIAASLPDAAPGPAGGAEGC